MLFRSLMPYPINQRAHQFNLFWNHGGRAAAIVEGLRQINRSACCELDVVKYFRHQQVSNLKNALLNDLTAFEEERCRQSKRKLDVLVRCMKLVFLFLCSVLDISFINS